VPEELYDFSADPDALHNLIDDPAYAEVAADLRRTLADHLADSGDWAAEMFAMRHQPERLSAAVQEMQDATPAPAWRK